MAHPTIRSTFESELQSLEIHQNQFVAKFCVGMEVRLSLAGVDTDCEFFQLPINANRILIRSVHSCVRKAIVVTIDPDTITIDVTNFVSPAETYAVGIGISDDIVPAFTTPTSIATSIQEFRSNNLLYMPLHRHSYSNGLVINPNYLINLEKRQNYINLFGGYSSTQDTGMTRHWLFSILQLSGIVGCDFSKIHYYYLWDDVTIIGEVK